VTATSRCTWSLPVPASSGGAFGLAGMRRRQRRQHPLHALGIGARRLGLLLRAAQLRGRDHLHRRGDLLRRFDAVDAVAQAFRLGIAPTRRSWRSRRGSRQLLLGVRLDLDRSRIAHDRTDRLRAQLGQQQAPRSGRCRRSRSCRDSPHVPAKIATTCSSTGSGRELRLLQQFGQARAARQQRCVEASRSEANCANAAISRYCASSSLMRAGDLLHRLDLRRRADAADRQPTFTAGRMPLKNSSVSRKIWPSVIEITLVGI
jgi:hypothetical protein